MIENIYKNNIREMRLVDLVNIRAARQPSRVENYPFDSSLPYMDIQALVSGNPERFAEKSGYIVGEEDILVVKDGYRSGRVFHAKEGIAASTLTILSPKGDEVQMSYLYCYLSYCYDDFQNRKKGSAIWHLDMNYLRQLNVPIPDRTLQQIIAEKYHGLEILAAEIRKKALQLKELSGELDNKKLKKQSESLNLQVEMTLKAWLYQIFKRTL